MPPLNARDYAPQAPIVAQDETIATLKQQLEQSGAKQDALKALLAVRDETISKLKQQVEQSGAKQDALRAVLAVRDETVSKLSQQVEPPRVKGDALKALLAVRDETISKLKQQVEQSGAKQDALRAVLAVRDETVSKLSQQVEPSRVKGDALKALLAVRDETISKLKQQVEQSGAKQDALRAVLAVRDETVSKLSQQAKQSRADVDALRTLVAARDALGTMVSARDELASKLKHQMMQLRAKEDALRVLVAARTETITRQGRQAALWKAKAEAFRAQLERRDTTSESRLATHRPEPRTEAVRAMAAVALQASAAPRPRRISERLSGEQGQELGQVFCASIPRSGHHHLMNLLAGCVDGGFRYCHSDGPPCCMSIPCTMARKDELLLKKSHDADLSLTTEKSVVYLIQYREPVGQLLSFVEQQKRALGDAFPIEDPGFAEDWLAAHAAYFVGFHKKWILRPPPRSVRVDYARLVTSPVAVIGEVFEALSRRPPSEGTQFSGLGRKGGPLRPTPLSSPRYQPPRDNSISPLLPLRVVHDFADFVLAEIEATSADATDSPAND